DRSVIRRALSALRESDLISRRPGYRPFVNDPGTLPPAHNGERPRDPAVQTIAAILPQHATHPSTLAILYGINRALHAQEAPYRLTIFDNYGGQGPVITNIERRALEAVETDDTVAGVLLWHMAGAATVPSLRRLQDRGLPIVFIDRYPQE